MVLAYVGYGLLAVVGVYLLLLVAAALSADPNKTYERPSGLCRFLLDITVRMLVFFGRVHVEVTGLEKLPKDGRFLLVGNHRSNYDPIVQLAVMQKYKLAFISKPENFKIPLVGRILRRCCFLPIDRENPRNAITTIHAAARLMEDDQVSVGVYPEGTRSRTGELLPFHGGVLKIAQQAHVPVVVAAIQGVEGISRNFPLRRTNVRLDILETLPADYVAHCRSAALGNEIRDTLEAYLPRTQQPYPVAHTA